MTRIFLFFITLIVSFSAMAQRIATDFGDVYFDFFHFKEAAEYYEEALLEEKKPIKQQYLYKQLTQAYKYQFKYPKAEEYFKKYMTSGQSIEPEFYIDYGNILKLNGKYKEAKEMYKKYQEVTNTDLAESFIRSVNWAILHLDTIRNCEIVTTNLNINGQSLGYCYYDDGLLYSHSRSKPRKEKEAQIFDLDYARKMSITEFEPDMKLMTFIEFDLNEGGPCVSQDGQRLYFYANNTALHGGKPRKVGSVVVDIEGVSNFKLYMAASEGGMFKDPKPLPFCDAKFSYMHPTLSEDGKTLYFSSNKEGGFGGFDLYKVPVSFDDNWAEPVNLGKNVNTDENEIFPYINDGMLYFASKGFNSYGGYDIFIAKLNKLGFPNTLKNMGQPINSFRDDVALITRDGGYTGYFSSNRDNGDGYDYVYYFSESAPDRYFELYGKKDSSLQLSSMSRLTNPQKIEQPNLATNTNQKVDAVVGAPAPGVKPKADASITNNEKGKAPATIENPAIAANKAGVKPKVDASITNNQKAKAPATIATPAIASNKDGANSKVNAQPVSPNSTDETKNMEKVQPEYQQQESTNNTTYQANKPKKQTGQKGTTNYTAVNSANKIALIANIDELTKLNFSHTMFEFNKAGIGMGTMLAADSIVVLAKSAKGVKIFITAHADSRGSFSYNLALSERRAATAKKYLIAKGVSASRIITRGLGESQLLNECADGIMCTNPQHAINRRVEMKLVK